MIVIACNTASSAAYKEVVKTCGKDALVVNVVDPVVEYVADQYDGKHVGIIGTKGTIGSRVYPRKLKQLAPGLVTASAATPLLAPMIEEGFFNNLISKTIINNYLDRSAFAKIEALVLGCTHYPLIKPEVQAYYQGKVEIVDSASVVADAVQLLLSSKDLLRSKKSSKIDEFYVSDYTQSFEKSTRYFFADEVKLSEARIWVSEE